MNRNHVSPGRRLVGRSKSGNSLIPTTSSTTSTVPLPLMERQSYKLHSLRRAKSYSHIHTLALDLVQLEKFLLVLADFSEDSDLRLFSRDQFLGLAARLSQTSRKNSYPYRMNELNEVVTCLSALLQNAAPHLPKRMIARAHSYTGMIHEEQGRSESAVQSLMKALWIQTSLFAMDQTSSQDMTIEIALTNHRLGITYGRMGDYEQAVAMLEQALQVFEQARMKSGHVCVLQTQAALDEFRAMEQLDDISNRKCDLSKSQPLSLEGSFSNIGSSSPQIRRVSLIRIG